MLLSCCVWEQLIRDDEVLRARLRTPIVGKLTRSVTKAKRKTDSGEEKRNQDNSRLRLQFLSTGEKLLDKFLDGCLHGPSRHDLNRILSGT